MEPSRSVDRRLYVMVSNLIGSLQTDIAMHELSLAPFLSKLGFAEGPRWHQGSLWFSDIVQRKVMRARPDGELTTVLSMPGEPSGLGWLPDGSLLVVSMDEHDILRWHEGRLSHHAHTAPISRAKLNDMVVDRRGRAWVSNLGFDYETEAPRTTHLVFVDSDGRAASAAADIHCPNGMALNEAEDRLYVGQSASSDILEFSIAADGSLHDRRVFATLPSGSITDGLCLDAEEGLWIASPVSREFLRVERGGAISHRIATGERHAIACVLGGPERRTLYCATAATMSLKAAHQTRDGRIEVAQVDIPGAGKP